MPQYVPGVGIIGAGPSPNVEGEHKLLIKTLKARNSELRNALQDLVDLLDSVNYGNGTVSSVDLTAAKRALEC
jgi:hypothetical protein